MLKLRELQLSLRDLRGQINAAKDVQFASSSYLWVTDIFVEHSTLGTCAIIEVDGTTYQVPFVEVEGKVVLEATSGWVAVTRTYVPNTLPDVISQEENYEELIEESDGITLVESSSKALKIKARVIKEGFGNLRDNNYYSKGLLSNEATAAKFVGAKMYLTEHKVNEVNVRTEVAQILSCVYSEEQNGLEATIGVFDEAFAANIRNREELGVLDGLHLSIRASGTVEKEQFVLGSRKGTKVAEFTNVSGVDFVTRAGAGGQVLGII